MVLEKADCRIVSLESGSAHETNWDFKQSDTFYITQCLSDVFPIVGGSFLQSQYTEKDQTVEILIRKVCDEISFFSSDINTHNNVGRLCNGERRGRS